MDLVEVPLHLSVSKVGRYVNSQVLLIVFVFDRQLDSTISGQIKSNTIVHKVCHLWSDERLLLL